MANAKDRITRLVTQQNPAEVQEFVQAVKTAPDSTCRAIITQIKKILKDKSSPPTVKLAALRVGAMQLFHECMCVSNVHFLLFAQKKILRRFGEFAKHKKGSADPNRGADLFGALSGENSAASAEFLRCLLTYIKIWAARYGMAPNNSDSDYLKLYRMLLNERVVFPADPNQPQQPASPRQQPNNSARFKSDIDKCKQTADLLRQMLASNPHQSEVPPTAAQVEAYKTQLEVEIQARSNRQSNETEMNLLLDAHDYLSKILETYESMKRRAAPAADPRAASLQATLRQTQQSIDQAEKELSEIRDRIYYRRSSEDQSNPEQIRREVEAQLREREEKHRQRLVELDRTGDQALELQLAETQRQVELLQAALKQKAMEIERDNKAYAQLTAENRELTARLEEAKRSSPPISPQARSTSPNFFDSARPSLNPFGAQSSLDSAAFQTMRTGEGESTVPQAAVEPDTLPIQNEKEYKQLCLQDRGLLFSDSLVQMGALLQLTGTTGKMGVFLGNAGSEVLESVSLQMIQPEGVQIVMEPKSPGSVSPGQKSVFNFGVTVQAPFAGCARLVAVYVHRKNPVYVHLKLPLVIARVLTPTKYDGNTALRAWQSLATSEGLVRFNALQAGINSMNSLASLVRFRSNLELFGVKEIPQLDKGSILGLGEFQERLVGVMVTVEGNAKGGKIAVRSQDTKLRDTMLGLLKDFIVG